MRSEVAVLGVRGIPGVMGGVESHCEEILPLVRQRIDVSIAVLSRAPYVREPRRSYRGVDLVPLYAPRGKHTEAIAHSLLGILYARAVLGCRVVHLHGIGPGLLSPLVKLLGMRLVVTHHGDDFNREKWGRFARFALRTGEKLSLTFADYVACVSRSGARRLKETHPGSSQKVRFVPNGVSTAPDESNAEALLSRHGLTSGRFVVGVGRLVPEKRFDDLVEAFNASGLDMKLVIAGGSDHEDAYAKALRAKASDRVVFTGRLPREAVFDLYRHASLFVLPSTHEGLPVAALEALSVGTPVLLSDIEPCLDMDLPSGSYFPARDVGALSRALARPHRDYAMPSEEFRQRFSWEASADQIAELYRICLERPRRSAGFLGAIAPYFRRSEERR